MRFFSLLPAIQLAYLANGYKLDFHDAAVDAAYHVARALPNSPNGYAPSFVQCPANTPFIRSANGLSPNETAFLSPRRNNTIAPMKDLLNRLNISGFDATGYINNVSSNPQYLPNIAIAASGGGWRACMNGGGGISAMDSREPGSTGSGQIGGLLQASTYVAGLSGGGWLVSSIYVNNFSTVTSLRDSGTVWQFDQSIFEGPDNTGITILDTADYWAHLVSDVSSKENAGFKVSLSDFWGRALSYQLINASQGGPAYTWSSISLMSDFQNGLQPFPIILTDNRAPGVGILPTNATIVEVNPFEFGSFDPTLYAFAPLQYIGTNFTNGSVVDTTQCVVGFDNAGFMLGAGSTLFNEYMLFTNTSLPSVVSSALSKVLGDWNDNDGDYADFEPNPFYEFNATRNIDSDTLILTQVDGGEDNQNLPFAPLILPARHVDVIFAIDSSADTAQSWPNGSALVATYERSLSAQGNGTTYFPSIPDENTMINKGLNTRPTFFGCNASNMTNGVNVPLIVYLPNYPYVTYSNESTITFTTNDSYRNAIIQNGYDVVTMANGTRDSQWPQCVGCAILLRSMTRTNTTLPAACNQCFSKYCWDGSLNSTQPAPYYPTTYLAGSSTSNGGSSTTSGSAAAATSSKGAAAQSKQMNSFGPLAAAVGLGIVAFPGLF